MKMDERLANMSVNHKAKLCNRLLRKVYPGTQDLSDIKLSQICEEIDRNPKARVFLNILLKGYGLINIRKITDWIPGYGLSYNPVKMEVEIDKTLKYYTFMMNKSSKKEVLLNSRKKDKKGKEQNLYGLDNREKGGWNWDETTGKILRRDTDGVIDYLATGIETLKEAQQIVNNLNKEIEGDVSTMTKNKKGKSKKAKKASQVIEETVEEIEEEVEKEAEEEESKPKKTKKAEKPAAKTPIDDNAVGVKELAGMVNMDPKALRKVLREMFPEHEPKSQWTWKRDSKDLSKLVNKLNK